jgi:hypothetical protein
MNKIKKIWGIGLIVVLTVSLFGFAMPASAGTLSWSDVDIPDSTGKVVVPGTDITDFDVSGDGMTVYVVDNEGDKMYKSTNAGDTWTEITMPSEAADPQLVSVAPDDADLVAIVADDDEVYVTTNGGTTWLTALATVQESGGDPATSISDIDVSVAKSGDNYVAVAGIETGGEANVWYYNLGVGGYWHETNDKDGFNSSNATPMDADAALAVAWSPNFNSDSVLTSVMSTDNGTNQKVTFQMFSENIKAWNNAAGFGSGFPVTIATDTNTNITGVDAASIALAPTYLGSDDSERIAFVGLALSGTSTGQAKAGVVRLKNDSDKLIREDSQINSVTYDGDTLVAGHYDAANARYSTDPLDSSPTFSSARSLKKPQGEDHVIVAWADGKLLAGASGAESAFCVSENSGKSFNGISLVDTNNTALDIEDVAVSVDGSKTFMATSDDGSNLSIWRQASSWARVLSVVGSTGNGFILRMAPDNNDAIYAAEKGTKEVYYTTDGGEEKWFTRTARYNVGDMAVESEDIAYIAISGTDTVSKTTNGGFTWGSSKDAKLQGGNIHTIVSLSEDNLVVGSTEGYVSYSTDGGSNFTWIEDAVSGADENLQVAASGLEEGDFIYATGSNAEPDVRRWEIGGTSWTNLEATANATDMAYGIALHEGTLYIALSDGTNSKVLRTLSPTTDVPLSSYWSTMSSSGEAFNRTPSSLKVSASSGDITLWAIDNAGTSDDQLFYFKDILATVGITLAGPADGKNIGVNPISGNPNEVSLTWERPPKGREYTYDVKVALDTGFKESVVSTTKTTTSSTPNYTIAGTSLNLGTTYYWRIRVATDGPVRSAYSETRSFTVEPGAAVSPSVLAPENGKTGVGLVPAFSWSPVAGATSYEFQLAVAPHAKGWGTPVYEATIAETGIVPTVKLDYDMTYFWRVRSAAPIEGSWSAIANFTTMAEPTEPTPPVVVEEVPPPVINIPAPPPAQEIVIPPAPQPPAPIAPAYIWAIIIIGAVLVIAVIVLIVRTRRVV